MEQAIQHGADIIIRDWVRLRAGERILIVSSRKYAVEVAAMQQAAQAVGSVADVLMLDDLHEQVGQYFDDREDAFDPYNAVIGAAEYSLITTRSGFDETIECNTSKNKSDETRNNEHSVFRA